MKQKGMKFSFFSFFDLHVIFRLGGNKLDYGVEPQKTLRYSSIWLHIIIVEGYLSKCFVRQVHSWHALS